MFIQLPASSCWLALLLTDSHTLKAHLRCFILCTLVESYLFTLASYHNALKQKDASPQTLFKQQLLQVIDALVDTSEATYHTRQYTLDSLIDEAEAQRSLCWLDIPHGDQNIQPKADLMSPAVLRDVIFVVFQELGLFFSYLEDFFLIRFKAVITKAVRNDKYFFLLNPPLRSFDEDDASGPLFSFEVMDDLERYGQCLLHEIDNSSLNTTKLEDVQIYAENIFKYTHNFSHKPSCLIGLYLIKCLSQALISSSIDKGKPWLDKVNEIVADSHL